MIFCCTHTPLDTHKLPCTPTPPLPVPITRPNRKVRQHFSDLYSLVTPSPSYPFLGVSTTGVGLFWGSTLGLLFGLLVRTLRISIVDRGSSRRACLSPCSDFVCGTPYPRIISLVSILEMLHRGQSSGLPVNNIKGCAHILGVRLPDHPDSWLEKIYQRERIPAASTIRANALLSFQQTGNNVPEASMHPMCIHQLKSISRQCGHR